MNHKMDFVRQSYSDIAQGKQDTILSSSPDQQALNVSVGYSEEEISLVPPAANMGLGCGNPFRIVEVKEGDTLIDLGSGAGFDCFLASHKVGRKGRVIGVDMTPEMLSLARRTAKENRYRNVEFRLGEIENLPAADNLADVVISNCVINLSQNKPRVYREILRVLKPGGAIGISDIVIMKELPKEIKQDDQMYACWVSGASSVEELEKIIRMAGFCDISIRTEPVSRAYEEKWGGELTVGQYILSAKVFARKPPQPCAETVNSACLCRQKLL